MLVLRPLLSKNSVLLSRVASFSTSNVNLKKHKVLIVGGGAGGLTVANRIAGKLEDGQVTIIEPSDKHYYQPLWTLVGAGIYDVEKSVKNTRDYVPNGAKLIQDSVKLIEPSKNLVTLSTGEKISYDWLVLALGMSLNYDQIKGAEEALAKDPRVCSNYTYEYCQKTFKAFEALPAGGTAIFTHPNSPVKCGGAPQKIMYLLDDYLCKNKKRDGVKIEFVISLPGMFSVPHYSDALMKIADSRNIYRSHRQHLTEVQHDKSTITVQNLDDGTTKQMKYDLLHIVPPMSAPKVISSNTELTTPESNGYVHVDKFTLRSPKFPNIFALGDCSSLPTSKTAAAVASESDILSQNLISAIHGDTDFAQYSGYTSCPLITGYDRGIIAEFGYDNKLMETMPFDQSKERYIFAWLKQNVLPTLYWNGMLPGLWPGPKYLRKLINWKAN